MARMTKDKREQSLIKARAACERLRGYEFSTQEVFRFQQHTAPDLGFFLYNLKEVVANLIAGFEMLDEKEQKQADAGRQSGHLGAEHGHKGGRPKKQTEEK